MNFSLELWNYDDGLISNLTDEDVLVAVNDALSNSKQ